MIAEFIDGLQNSISYKNALIAAAIVVGIVAGANEFSLFYAGCHSWEMPFCAVLPGVATLLHLGP